MISVDRPTSSDRRYQTEQWDIYIKWYSHITTTGLSSLLVISYLTGTNASVNLIVLSHWGRVMHICVSKLTIIGSDNGLSPDRRQAITWNSAGILFVGHLWTNFDRNLYIFVQENAFESVVWKMAAILCRPQCVKWQYALSCVASRWWLSIMKPHISVYVSHQ